MNPSPWSRRAGAGPMGPGRRTGSGIIAAVVLLVVYAVVRSGRISSEEVIFFVVLIPSIIIHEVSHGWVALACGDDTAKRAGRLTLNPLRHVDPLGTVILPIILVLTVHSAFGYAKPVPVNVSRLRHPRNQSLLVGLAGPAVNLLLAALAALVLRLIAPAGTKQFSNFDDGPGAPAGAPGAISTAGGWRAGDRSRARPPPRGRQAAAGR